MYDCVLVDYTLIWDDIVIIDVCIGGLPWDAIGPDKRRGTIGSPESGLATRIALGSIFNRFPDSKVHGDNIGLIWSRQDPGGPHVGPMNFVIWVELTKRPSIKLDHYAVK